MPNSFSRKLELAFGRTGQLCVGIDPHPEILLENGFSDSVSGLRDFSQTILDSLDGLVSIVKPQVSFFERFGSAGFKALEELLSQAQGRGFLVIADAKRGDIGTTMTAYASAWLDKDAPFICDALTVSPFLGVGSLDPMVATAAERGKGLFILAATSNPEAKLLQSALIGELTVSAQIAKEVDKLNSISAQSASKFGHVGLVIGATIDPAAIGFSLTPAGNLITPILAPGFGAQGAELRDAKEIFGPYSKNVIYSVSRSALRGGIESIVANVIQDQKTLAEALTK